MSEYDAVIRDLEMIGETAKQLPEAFRRAHPELESGRLGTLRDIMIEAQAGPDQDIVFDVVKNKLAVIRDNVRRLLRENS